MKSMILVALLLFVVYTNASRRFSFPSDAPWYQDVSRAPLDPNSANVINYLASNGLWSVSPKFQIDTSINIQYADDSTPRYSYAPSQDYTLPDCDNVDQFPVVSGGLIEGQPYDSQCDGDCHYIVVDTVNNKLYENYQASINTLFHTISGTCAVVWDLCLSYPSNLRGDQCTSADAAGFPIAPLLVTADELASGSVDHALRFIVPNRLMAAGQYVHPASHAGGPSSSDPNAIPYGAHLRLRADFNPSFLSEQPASSAALVVIAALKKYGMFLADGGNIPLTFADDTYTTNKYEDLNFDSHSLWGIAASDFEVVAHDAPTPLTYDCVRNNLPPSSCGAATTAPTSSPPVVPTAFSFPADSIWYKDISSAPVDPSSDAVTSYLDANGLWSVNPKFQIDTSLNIQYANAATPRFNVIQANGYPLPDCDDIHDFPVPLNGLIEGQAPYNSYCDGDCHFLVVDTVNNKLYESYATNVDVTTGSLSSACAVEWDLCRSYPDNLRGDQCTSSDAAGFPIAPLLVTADELAAGAVNHALRFIAPNRLMARSQYVHPATHAGGPSSSDPNAIIYGTRLRLKASFNPSSLSEQPVSQAARVVIQALKKYGMFLADGGNIPLTFADDAFTTHKYEDLNFDSHSLWGIKATDFEVIAHSAPVPLTYDCVRNDLPPLTCGSITTAASATFGSATSASSGVNLAAATAAIAAATTATATATTAAAAASSAASVASTAAASATTAAASATTAAAASTTAAAAASSSVSAAAAAIGAAAATSGATPYHSFSLPTSSILPTPSSSPPPLLQPPPPALTVDSGN